MVNQVKERPILFSAPWCEPFWMAKKTQTRRVCKVAERYALSFVVDADEPGYFGDEEDEVIFSCPYGKPVDRLWVRETWQHENYPWGPYDPDNAVFYRADYIDDELGIDLEKSRDGIRRKWNPSIHMPRSASRILLEVTNVRVERLRDISEEDAIAEGVIPSIVGSDLDHLKYRAGYQTLWESINGHGSWDLNPWVWVVEYRVLKN